MIEKDKKVEELLKGNFDEPTPSQDFTNNIMDKIAAQEVILSHTEVEYVPVISKTGWIIIVGSFLFIVFLGLLGKKESQFSMTNYIPEWHFDLSIAHSQLVLISVLGILTMLIIDRLLMRFRLD
tara:strand:+ start:796 stop:1167 length:372 start_codon:yes stop_codon:yes gene_type:complete